jgi:acetylornithine/succinyldiaminopimelate/putrescine aminotransferase
VDHREVETSPNRFSVVNAETNQHGRTACSVSAVAERYRAARRTEWERILDELCARMGRHRKHAVPAL